MNKISLREIKKEATAHALAKAAFELAVERGMDSFVVEDVVQRAGYSRRTFANHFSCKEEAVVVGALTISGMNDVEHMLAELPEDIAPVDVLYQLIRTQFATGMFSKLREVVRLSKRHPALEPHILSVFRDLLLAGQETLDDLFKDRYPEGYTHVLIGAVYGAVLPVIDGSVNVLLPGQPAEDSPGASTFEQYLATVFGYLRNGF